MLTIRAIADGAGYSENHLQYSDYFDEHDRVQGHWSGLGAAMLGLAGLVDHKNFEALRQGLHPETGEFIRQRHSADRTGKDGSVQSHAQSLFDITFSAPKSVSIMAVLGEDPRLTKAHEAAVAEALNELERHAAARVRIGGANHDRRTGNIAMAVYTHDASRELDPQLHSHCVAFNLTFDEVEGRWKALQASEIYKMRAYLSEVYRNALAYELKALGYEIENRIDRRGKDCVFEIAGIPETLREKFSQRSKQRDEAIAVFTAENGRPPTDNETAVLVRETRSPKLQNISTEEVRRKQMGRMEPEEIELLQKIKSKAKATSEPVQAKDLPPERLLQEAMEHIFERVSVAHDYEILTEALLRGRGEIDLNELKESLLAQERQGSILRKGSEIATKQSLDREREMIRFVNNGIGAAKAIDGKKHFIPDKGLNAEQKNAVEFALHSRDLVMAIIGTAGAGKTTMLKELGRGIRESGYDSLAVAPTRSAVEELQKVGFTEAVTIQRLLQDPNAQKRDCILIVDEAAMVSSGQMSDLLKLSDRLSCRVIFCGDTKQIQSVEAGDALRILQQESRLKSVSLTTEQRQATKDYRQAIHQLREDAAKGLDKLERMGAVLEVGGKDRAEAVAKAFSDFTDKGQSTIVVCATHDEIGRVTDAIRRDQRAKGKLGSAHGLERDVSLGWTDAHKTDISRLQPGHVLCFHKAVVGIEKNESLQVVSVDKGQATARNERGEMRTITKKQSKCFDVCERRPIEVAPGDKLLLTANRKSPAFKSTNGEIVTVDRIDEHGRINLTDGRTMPRDYRHFSHGYAVTAHRSQGKTVDAVIVSADGMKRELFYVAASRGRQGLAVVTSDKERLRESIGCSTARKSASELARDISLGLRQGPNQGIEAARRLALWNATQPDRIPQAPQTIQRTPTPTPTPTPTKEIYHGRQL